MAIALFFAVFITFFLCSTPLLYPVPILAYFLLQNQKKPLFSFALLWGFLLDSVAATPFGLFTGASMIAVFAGLKARRLFSIDSPWMEGWLAFAYSLSFSIISLLLLWFLGERLFGKISLLLDAFGGALLDAILTIALIQTLKQVCKARKSLEEEAQ